MMTNTVRVTSGGTSENGTIQCDTEVDETKSWFNRRFIVLIVIGLIASILLMVLVVVIILLFAKLRETREIAEKTAEQSYKQINEITEKMKEPLDKLGPSLEKLIGGPLLPGTVTAPPGVSPINPIVNGPTSEGPRRSPSEKYDWKGCNNVGKCTLSGFEKPPLVLLSLDGFARFYLDRNIVKTLEHMAECGVKGDGVYPSYPSKTFPNHYTMVTGLWPESHGLTDNNVFDPAVSPQLESMKTTNYSQFFGAEPIWSVYKRKTNGIVNCLFWIGCRYTTTEYKPDYAPEYDYNLSLTARIDKIIEWLKLPTDKRPGLMTIYFHEPDTAGHYQKNDNVNDILAELDDGLNYLMTRLKDEQVLECINLVIVSDHGMQSLDNNIYYEDHTDMKGLVSVRGVVGKIYVNDTSVSTADVVDKFRCKIDNVKVNTREDIPTRKHYSRDSRVGDIIMEGPPGTSFLNNRSEYDKDFKGDHGYDYFNPNMHAIFFARGPSFKQNVTITPFQNVQYMNLWMSLLGIEGAVDTNGTIGFFDSILTNPPARDNNKQPMGECPVIGLQGVSACSSNVDSVINFSFSAKIGQCVFKPNKIPFVSNNHCLQMYCDNTIVMNRNTSSKSKVIMEELSRDEPIVPANFTYVNTKYDTCTSQDYSKKINIATRNTDQISNVASIFFDFPENFVKKVWNTLQAKTAEYLNKFEKLYVITGTASDVDRDGIADHIESNATHIFRIILKCKSFWITMNPPVCSSPDQMDTISFIFPIMEKSAVDCMTPDNILLDHMSTIYDIEQISGLKFHLDAYNHNQNVIIRRKITTQLW